MAFKTGEHPRLLFSAEELDALRASAESGLKARVLDRVKQLCANYMDPAHPQYLDFGEREKDIWLHGITESRYLEHGLCVYRRPGNWRFRAGRGDGDYRQRPRRE